MKKSIGQTSLLFAILFAVISICPHAMAQTGQRVDFRYKGKESTLLLINKLAGRPLIELDPLVEPLVSARARLEKEASLLKLRQEDGYSDTKKIAQARELYDQAAKSYTSFRDELVFDIQRRKPLREETKKAAESAAADAESAAERLMETKGIVGFILGVVKVVRAVLEVAIPIQNSLSNGNSAKLNALVEAVTKDLAITPFDQIPVAPKGAQ